MATFKGQVEKNVQDDGARVKNWQQGPGGPTNPDPQWGSVTPAELPALKAEPQGVYSASERISIPSGQCFKGQIGGTPASDFFGKVIVLPRKIEAGLVLNTKTFTITIDNTYRTAKRVFQGFANTAGDGVTIINLPALSLDLPALSGLSLTLEVTLDGPATISGNLEFTFDTRVDTVPVTGQRSVTLGFPPETPMIEKLQFLTDVIEKRVGTEQRVSLRETPRQIVEMDLRIEGDDARLYRSIMASSQARTFGLPIWWEPTVTTSAVAVNDTTINVETTANADYRVGGLAVIWTGHSTMETLQIKTINATSLEFESASTQVFASGTRVMPVRQAFTLSETVRGNRHPKRVVDQRLVMTILDNDVDLSDVSAFPAFESKVLFNGKGNRNVIRGRTLGTESRRRIHVIDNRVGKFEVHTEQALNVDSSRFTLNAKSRARLWQLRQLAHGLRGNQVSFFAPTYAEDFIPTQAISSTGTTLVFENSGFSRLINAGKPFDVVMVRLTDGTEIIRRISSASEIDSSEEQVEVSAVWGVNAQPGDIELVCLAPKTRISSDEVTFTHRDGNGNSTMSFPTITVLD